MFLKLKEALCLLGTIFFSGLIHIWGSSEDGVCVIESKEITSTLMFKTLRGVQMKNGDETQNEFTTFAASVSTHSWFGDL